MDKRSWPWKKKSSDKAAVEKAVVASEDDQDNHKKPTHVQISVESYSHLTGLEDQVKEYEDQVTSLEDQIKELNEKLSAAQSEMITKENLVKQHAKVAEEAVSGWEKAEEEASTLKNHLESVTLLKLTVEDRASHLDGALKECMRQIRNLKEEHEQKLHDVVLTKTKQWDKIRHELEAKMANMDQELRKAAAENVALSRSLQDRSNMLIQLSEEKSQAEAEIELLKSNIESCEREVHSHKYELHLITKELEIRNEEKNMSAKSAEVANKQHLEGVKKIAKLEAECQRLRGLVRKKLPGPAALAQMKLEVESLGRDHSETRLRRSPVRPPSPHLPFVPEFSLESVQKFNKENEFLTERLLAMEEEMKMLKEALATRNSELQASRSLCAKTVSKIQTLEAQLQVNSQKNSPQKSNVHVRVESSLSQYASSPPSLTSMSEDGNDDEGSCSGSWATASVSELSHIKKESTLVRSNKAENATDLELMDDFLEMEKLANSSNDSNGDVSGPDLSNNKTSEMVNHDALIEVTTDRNFQSKEQPEPESPELNISRQPLIELQSRISMMFDSLPKDANAEKVLEDIRHVVKETHDSLQQQSVSSLVDHEACPQESIVTEVKEILLSHDSYSDAEKTRSISHELAAAVSKIHDFVLFLGKETEAVQGTSHDQVGLSEKFKEFSATFDKVLINELSLVDFVLDLSDVLAKASEFHFNVFGYKKNEGETNGSDCIDKVALPENKVAQNPTGEGYVNGCTQFSDSTSDPDIPHEGSVIPLVESNPPSWKCSQEEFEHLKLEKDSMVMDLARCTEDLESTKSQLQETEKLLAEVKSQLASAEKSNSLGETQLKCMAESYRSLEARAEELQTEINALRVRSESLDNELQEERKSRQDALDRCKDLQEQLQKFESQLAVNEMKTSQERDLEAAAEKLAECQETIFMLGKQLKSLRPQTEFMGSPSSERSGIPEEESTTCSMNLHDFDQTEVDSACAPNSRTGGAESSTDLYNSLYSPSDSETNTVLSSPVGSKLPKHRPTKSGSSFPSAPTPEKHSRGLSRFFSKGKNDH